MYQHVFPLFSNMHDANNMPLSIYLPTYRVPITFLVNSKHTPYGYNVSMGAACRRAGYASKFYSLSEGTLWTISSHFIFIFICVGGLILVDFHTLVFNSI